MSRQFNDLCPVVRTKALALFARCAEQHVWLILLDVLRDVEKQEEYVRTGASKTMDSLHLPQTRCVYCKGMSHALDAAPIKDLDSTDIVKAIEWDQKNPAWATYGRIAKSLGFTWGGDWGWDFSHVEIPVKTQLVGE